MNPDIEQMKRTMIEKINETHDEKAIRTLYHIVMGEGKKMMDEEKKEMIRMIEAMDESETLFILTFVKRIFNAD